MEQLDLNVAMMDFMNKKQQVGASFYIVSSGYFYPKLGFYKRFQFITPEANKTRCVTSVHYVVGKASSE